MMLFLMVTDLSRFVLIASPSSSSSSIYTMQINSVVMRGLNDDELCDFVELTRDKVG